GTESKAVVSLIDIFPTLLNMNPGSDLAGYNLDGASLWPIIKGKDLKEKRDYVVSTFGRGNNVVIGHDWQYIHYFDGSEELYNMNEDPEQFNNLANDVAYNTIKKELHSQLPEYPEVKHFVRMDEWKAIIHNDKQKKDILFNIYENNGIMESRNLIDDKQEVYQAILKGLEDMVDPGKYIALGNNP